MNNFMCEKCGQWFSRETILKRHLDKGHRGGEQFNCDKCSFQTTTQNLLDKHKVLAGHLPDIREKQYKCKDCPESFTEFSNLMIHRKRTHNVKQCRNLPGCTYGEGCWYMHPQVVPIERTPAKEFVSTDNTHVFQSSNFTCRLCNSDFNAKHELMRHRKSNHSDIVRQCTDFASSFCRRGDQQCWYRHSMNQETNSQKMQPSQDFRQGQQTMKPPESSKQQEIIQSMMTQMKTMMVTTMNQMMMNWK